MSGQPGLGACKVIIASPDLSSQEYKKVEIIMIRWKLCLVWDAMTELMSARGPASPPAPPAPRSRLKAWAMTMRT